MPVAWTIHCHDEELRQAAQDWLAQAQLSGAPLPQAGELLVRIVREPVEPPSCADAASAALAAHEGYALVTSGRPPRAEAQIGCGGRRGLYYALEELRQLAGAAHWREVRQRTAPRFPVRGIVEGFYGPPWTAAQRLEMLAYIAARRMNTYVYAPKDDPYHRSWWREPYDGPALEQLAALLARAQELALDFVYCLSPGLSMRYAADEDYRALLTKTRQLFDLGVRRFGLLLDDIPPRLQHRMDVDAFPDLTSAQIALIRRYYADLLAWDPAIRLVVCPTGYWGKGDEPELAALGAGIDPRIDLFWTGRNICSQELTLAEAALFSRSAHRPPLYWDNYPVNDMAMTCEMHIGPYRLRDRHLYRFSRGIIANVMPYAACSRLPLATIADYAWDPEGYDPEASWQAALARSVPDELQQPLALLADNVRASCFGPPESPALEEALARSLFNRLYQPEAGDWRLALESHLTRLAAAADALRDRACELPLLDELRPWTEQFAGGIRLLQQAADCLAAPSEATCRLLRAALDHYERQQRHAQVFGDVLSGYVLEVLAQSSTPTTTKNEGC
ncbi:beta-N-acetylglucosaminidase domain-containing protein [Paenibacillus sp. IB182496]|uniref:Beta-N-acetylglucosaminidase domain-containing protein n=1 Tax=Paenibacillus sabuli TaxID=2772509 RepID=A0A927BR40_9BACL|nr:protein O-GlcNAcase [Paenibacillus sabuli]MBD2843999.1 beta-N-acetylglucosaminidase domain-containing protein [Paenibacillus sabuli]